ncbi:MAG: prolipoprotein diacylglyceryl transferase [Oscillospiraceae bacterium]|nr:prolipoprotein diacylglyceryl transferase [Oscillospiraceae bacterium]
MEWIKADSPIAFPGLGFEINPPTGFTVGGFEVMFYGLIIGLGLVLCCIYGLRRGKDFGLTQDDILDGALWIIPFAIVCARLYYCAFYWEQGGYGKNPISILYIWEGGLAIYGGVIGAAIGIVVYCLCKKIPITTCLDITFVTFPIGQAIGRWGNFFNREAFGDQTESFLRMGLKLTEDGYASSEMFYYHPTFLYESLWNALGFVLLHFLSKKRKYEGQMALCYALWYGLGRTFIEGLRTDSLYWGPFRVSQLLAAVSAIAAAWILIWQMFRPHPAEKLYVNRVAAKKAAEAAVIVDVAEEETTEEEHSEKETPVEETEN